MEKNVVYIVHAIDAEGPLYESLEATFERLRDVFDLNLKPSYETLQKLRNREVSVSEGKEEMIAKFVDPKLLRYNDSWDKIDLMLSNIMGQDFRNELQDSYGGGWIYNWHCLDHVDYEVNPRRRDMGYHNIHDRYVEFIDKYSADMDSLQWHFHPMSFYREAHRCATSYENSVHLHQCLSRRIIDREFFPSVYRAGFQTIRPDSNWFLEQWIPFDCSSMAIDDYHEFDQQNDFKNGRSGDWRGAPSDWSVYHPNLYDWRKEGSLKRWIARFLNINTRLANINLEETDKAFARANEGIPTLLGITNHDFRDMAEEVNSVRELIEKVKADYPNVKFRFSSSVDAFNAVVNDGKYEELKLKVDLYKEEGALKLAIKTTLGEVFGPQPYLAIKTKSGRYTHDNLDFGIDGKSWYYTFDADSIHTNDLAAVGIAANNSFGSTFVKIIDNID